MPSSALELDVRGLPPPRRHPEIFRVFDLLKPGEAFVLVNDHDPKPLLHQLQSDRPGQFDWSVLEAAPKRFRVEIRRRRVEGARSVTEHLTGEHRRLDAILEEVVSLVDGAAFQEAGSRFAELECGLGRHIDIEEQLLFPSFEQTGGRTVGPTIVMRREHAEIRQRLERVAAALQAHDRTRTHVAFEELRQVLTLHNLKEERMLYPELDRATGDDRARDELVKRIQSF